MRISILTNGPGELWGWARPVIMELRKRGHSVSLWLLPCQFSSGHEREAASLLGIDKLEGPSNAAATWNNMAHEKTDKIIQLGGDIAFGQRLSEITGITLTCYTYGAFKKKIKNAKVLTAYKIQAEKFLPYNEALAIGDLVKDSLALDNTSREALSWDWKKEPDSPRILFLPGSRPKIRQATLEWLVEIKQKLLKQNPKIRIRTLFSQFMPESEFSDWKKADLNPIKASAGIAMQNADYALTQPGTNNFELMHCGLPALVVAPEKFIDVIPVAGLGGMISSLPILGKVAKRKALLHVIENRGGVIALPNRISYPEKVMDEIYGDVPVDLIVKKILDALNDKAGLEKTRSELLNLSGEGGAASRLCDIVLSK